MTNKPLKVKDLSENEQKELLQKMSAARLPGIHTEYKVETAMAKLGVNNEQNPATDEQTPTNNEQNGVNDEQNPNSDEQNGVNENVKNDVEKDKDKNQKADKTVEKSLICHICYGTVVKGVCQKCGYKYRG